jgi:16S rRNA C1402 N4-methylase RsmH
MPVDPTSVHAAYKEEEEKAKVTIKKLDAIIMDAGVSLFSGKK